MTRTTFEETPRSALEKAARPSIRRNRNTFDFCDTPLGDAPGCRPASTEQSKLCRLAARKPSHHPYVRESRTHRGFINRSHDTQTRKRTGDKSSRCIRDVVDSRLTGASLLFNVEHMSHSKARMNSLVHLATSAAFPLHSLETTRPIFAAQCQSALKHHIIFGQGAS
ncbi:MAG: hypothetical protein C3F11_01245 [Methylocystaceae bacterium]|nr:MAG: hypothetical protein C3F11_01245 [Methylocystaceae bacterium]